MSCRKPRSCHFWDPKFKNFLAEHAPRLPQVCRATFRILYYAADYQYLIAYEINPQKWKKRLGLEGVGGRGAHFKNCYCLGGVHFKYVILSGTAEIRFVMSQHLVSGIWVCSIFFVLCRPSLLRLDVFITCWGWFYRGIKWAYCCLWFLCIIVIGLFHTDNFVSSFRWSFTMLFYHLSFIYFVDFFAIQQLMLFLIKHSLQRNLLVATVFITRGPSAFSASDHFRHKWVDSLNGNYRGI